MRIFLHKRHVSVTFFFRKRAVLKTIRKISEKLRPYGSNSQPWLVHDFERYPAVECFTSQSLSARHSRIRPLASIKSNVFSTQSLFLAVWKFAASRCSGSEPQAARTSRASDANTNFKNYTNHNANKILRFMTHNLQIWQIIFRKNVTKTPQENLVFVKKWILVQIRNQSKSKFQTQIFGIGTWIYGMIW